MQNYLIVVDMQTDFVDGALGTKEAQAIVPAVKKSGKLPGDAGRKKSPGKALRSGDRRLADHSGAFRICRKCNNHR